MSDVVIPIVFPDYKISVSVPKAKFDPIPYFEFDNFSTSAYKERFSGLGHAGILFINGQTGSTKYFEYGRYDHPAYLGKVRKIMNLPNVIISNGKINLQSLKRTLYVISDKSGHNTRIQGVYIEVPNKFDTMLGYARLRKEQNKNSNRKPYNILSNSCVHFAKEVTQKAGVNTPWMIDLRPNSYIGEFRDDFIDLDFNFHKNQLKIEGKGVF
ncbi:hypothetical protein [Sulfurimonas sp.]|uniref:hypothetical protein n=1 Tax=Sulfurimonas sp. TaxID=2022749 RepID=UPI002B47A271|nr:hypothetical protein [Sulfurimonas sp.]